MLTPTPQRLIRLAERGNFFENLANDGHVVETTCRDRAFLFQDVQFAEVVLKILKASYPNARAVATAG